MDKFCVFCGESPEAKNKEHVLPQWLIEMTGDPKRMAKFGFNFTKQPLSLREFSFNSLVFPACSGCNTRFSKLEESVKPSFIRMLSHQPISSYDLMLLLDWLDKVRVGLWLGYLYLDKNPLGIDPNFYIASRIGRSDRMVAIIKMADMGTGLSFIGPEFKAYHLSPTCFALRANEFWLVNAAGISLCSQRLGFPYMEPDRLNKEHRLEALFKPGSARIKFPVERGRQLSRSVALYQPVFSAFFALENPGEFLDNDWVRDHTAHSGLGYGKVFLQKHNSVQPYPDDESAEWIPADDWPFLEITRLQQHVFDCLYRDIDRGIRLSVLMEDRTHLRRQSVTSRMLDRAILQKARRSLRELERQKSESGTA